MDSLCKNHPGPKIKTKDIRKQDMQWIDIGSGVMSRAFTQVKKMITTTKGGPPMTDIQT